ncbi:MAG TPA: isoprenylcysteine carboxylmethyltransferase family protein [Vicinamibacterales bacterium]|nr:isoprenylcysteine carboxylmethyltransferase family protein [Vicinamibacterales bacterium]
MPVIVRIARWRVPLGFLFGVAAVMLSRPSPRSLALGALVGVCGEAVRIWAAGHLEKGREVTRSGPYRWTRHPLYAGSSIMGVGLAIASRSLIVALLVIAYLAVTTAAAIRTEEAHLIEKFGSEYGAYREGTAAPVVRHFSLARAIRNREYRAALGFALVFTILALRSRGVL